MMARWLPLEIAVVSVLLLGPLALPSTVVPTSPIGWGGSSVHLPPGWGPQSTHLQHVITVVMENHDYDSFFGSYCLVLGQYCSSTGNGIPSGQCVLNAPSNPAFGCTRPFNLTPAYFTIADLYHDWISGNIAWDHGAMDGFYGAEGRGATPFGHFNGSTIPVYWDLAEQYASGDNMFAANLSYSLPNHWDLIAGQAPNISQYSKLRDTADRSTYLTQAANTSTIQDLLHGTGVTWKYYDSNLTNWSKAVSNVQYTGPYSAYDYWNPMAARNESYTPAFSGHFADRGSLLTDLANGTLPNISWVIPDRNASDHPGYNETLGQSWVGQLVDAVENSSYWGSTAIFVVWDDYGGWYDHVPPPRVMTKLLSFRSPFLVISPYAKQNYISHEFVDFFSLLRFVEWQFHVGCVTPLDCSAPLPFDFFDFNQTARPPILFATTWQTAVYPMELQSPGVPILCAQCDQTIPWTWLDGSSMTGNISLDT
jgi:phospholipase C